MKHIRKLLHDPIAWPNGKRFAFTIIDDTDGSTIGNVRPLYDFLAECGFRTTKTVWPLESVNRHITGGDSLENGEYAEWVLGLRQQGFEIAMHGAADEPSARPRTLLGLEHYRALLGNDPDVHINHAGQIEALYWGAARLDPPVRWAYALYRRLRRGKEKYLGHVPGSAYFWGDLAKARTRFVRNLVWPDINTLKMDPLMPYHDPGRAYVNWWFSASYGSGRSAFLRLLSPSNQDRLVEEGGACIVYTHLGVGFYPLSPEFVTTMRRLSKLPGWFVPVSELLNHIGEQRGWRNTSDYPLVYARVQMQWLYNQVRRNVG